MAARVFAGVDLGASSGRVVAGIVHDDRITVDVAHRFANGMREVDGHLRWDLSGLFEEVLVGIGLVVERYPDLESIGIDTWGVDYGLLDDGGNLLAEPVAYRDGRTHGIVEEVHARIAPDDLFRINGLQILPFNTLYQLEAEKRGPLWSRAAQVLLLPDLIAYWLTGQLATEYTNATTTGLVDARTRDWSGELLDTMEIRRELLPRIEQPGAIRGPLRDDLCERLGIAASVAVTTVGSHDTASAVAAVPASGRDFAFVSSGTWSLVGVETEQPILDAGAQHANFTNEGGVDGRIRLLRNVGGFWLVEESLRTWADQGETYDIDELVRTASDLPDTGARINVDDSTFLAPGDMPARVAADLEARGSPAPRSPAELVRCIIDSLASAYASAAHEAAELTSMKLGAIHVVGGGSQNSLLCQLTADVAEVPVVAGPPEATAIGNLLVQARACGAVSGSLEDLRAVVARAEPPRRFEPSLRSSTR